jgi:hypothetical protein
MLMAICKADLLIMGHRLMLPKLMHRSTTATLPRVTLPEPMLFRLTDLRFTLLLVSFT